ncbi:MAG: PH domain-containing protein [Bdellovibrionales bacterium]|nr:PH domain-containing protein [Bdellovibrionales bacterium]
MQDGSLVLIPKVWRSELARIGLVLLFCILSPLLSSWIPASVVSGRLFSIGSYTFNATLPLFWFLPFGALLDAVFQIYNVRYVIDSRSIEVRTGVLSLKQIITRVRYVDIRSIESDQTLVQRALDIGDLQIGTAATAGVEIVMRGIDAPNEVREVIQRERDRRLEIMRTVKVDEAASA